MADPWNFVSDANARNQFDRDDGYNSRGFNRERFHYNGTRYDNEGFDSRGYNRNGTKYDNKGFDSRGFNRERFHYNGTIYDYRGFNVREFNREGFHSNGTRYDDNGNDDNGFNIRGFNRDGFHRNGTRYDDSGLDIYGRRQVVLQPVVNRQILSLTNERDQPILYFSLNPQLIDNYPLTQIPVCNADTVISDSNAFHVHREFSKEKKQFMKFYSLLGNFDKEPNTDNSLHLFTEIQRLFTHKLHSINKALPDYDIKISIVIKSLKKLLDVLYDILLKPVRNWHSPEYCQVSRIVLTEAICDYSTKPPTVLPNLRVCDLYLRYIRNLFLLNDELFVEIIIEYAKSNLDAYNKHDGVATFADINRFFDIPRDISCDKGWIERLILSTNIFIKTKQLVEKNALQLFRGSTMHKFVEYLIKDLKIPIKLEEINFVSLIEEFKVSPENSNIKGNLEEQKKILIDKIYCY